MTVVALHVPPVALGIFRELSAAATAEADW
jgi:hypothetical protein